MREYIFTEKELKIITRYMQTGERLEGYTVLVSRCRRNLSKLEEHMKLAKAFIEKT